MPVVVKKPIGAFLSSKMHETINSFTKEISKVKTLRGHVIRFKILCLNSLHPH